MSNRKYDPLRDFIVGEEINIPRFVPQLDMPEEQEYGCLGRHKLW